MKKIINKKWMLDGRQIKKFNLKIARKNKAARIEFLTKIELN
jgi:hypothetical protein